MALKNLEKQAEMEMENEWVARKILAEPERYKPGSLMRTWAELVLSNVTAK